MTSVWPRSINAYVLRLAGAKYNIVVYIYYVFCAAYTIEEFQERRCVENCYFMHPKP